MNNRENVSNGIGIIEQLGACAKKFYAELEEDENARFRSWEHCYFTFYKAINENHHDYDYLALHLAFYLASWGMYRGSSFLLQKDYKVHIPAVKIVMKYTDLFGIECGDYTDEMYQRLSSLSEQLNDYYKSVYEKWKNKTVSSISNILITKILLGTLGCVPAFDRYFVSGVSELKCGGFSPDSIRELCSFYLEHSDYFESIRSKMHLHEDMRIPYPQMKVLDMAFWEYGKQKEENS